MQEAQETPTACAAIQEETTTLNTKYDPQSSKAGKSQNGGISLAFLGPQSREESKWLKMQGGNKMVT